jgi:ABC-2 type transport system permease protein
MKEGHKRGYISLYNVFVRECKNLTSRPVNLFCMIIVPLFCTFFFTSLMNKGLPTDLPVGAVDQDQTSVSRELLRNLDAFQQVAVSQRYADVWQARRAMQRGDIYGFFYIPKNTTKKALSSRRPTISFYTNGSWFIAGSLLYRDMRTMSELTNGAIARESLRAKGYTDDMIQSMLQPIVIDTHPINNPWLNYSVYLCNTLIPGVLMLIIFQITVYSIGMELKERTSRDWLRVGNNSIVISLWGKILPYTIVFFIVGAAIDVYLYKFLQFPCNSGLGPMLFAMLWMILASQATGVVMIGTFPTLRYGLCFASLWGVVSFSVSGFTFPCMAMYPWVQSLAALFPLRHYFLIYVDQALNGYPMIYSWSSYLALMIFIFLPFIIMSRLKKAMLYYTYMP